jgi:putative nucleotidyltransferase with HDIG domain
MTIAFVNERVLCDGRILPGGAAGSAEMLAALKRAGADRITFRRGLEAAELDRLLDVLAGPFEASERFVGRHVEFGYVDPDIEESMAQLRSCVEPLAGIHGSIGQEREIDLESLDDIVRSIATVVSAHAGSLLPLLETKRHDEYTFVHTTNVSVLSGALAELLGFPASVVRDVTIAALLHDVGKRRVPEEILNKPGSLDPEEMEIVRLHPQDGARMLLATPDVPRLAPIVAFEHHIRNNGGGYPEPPPGWKLDVASRIVQMADVWDAMRTNRPYTDALPPSKIREIMRARAGSMFDPELLDLFLGRVVATSADEGE